MSGVPKRPHDETVHQSSKHPHEDSGAYSKLIPSVSGEHHVPYDIGQDSRAAKTLRAEPRDADRRSPLHSVYRMPSSFNDFHADHATGTENRIESKDLKDSRDLRFENRDTKAEKELPGEARRDSQIAKSEKDVRVEGRSDDNKDTRHDQDIYNDSTSDIKKDKDGFGVVSSHLNWKESKEYRGKRYPDVPSGSLDPWHISRGNTPIEVGKQRMDSSTAEERDYLEAHEAVGENKIDSKSEDRFKDRKRRDVKHRELGDKEKERSDHRNIMQVNNTSGEGKEPSKEERDVEKWDKERKDLPKERDNSKDREKDNLKRESWNGMEKEVSNNEKELGDGSAKITEQEPEQKKLKDADSWKNVDREGRERRKERDGDVEGDRPEKRSKFDKQSEDGSADGEGTGDKEREVHNYNVQHRKRIQRSRGSPQLVNREPRFRSHGQHDDEAGESMQELIKLWDDYASSQSQVEKNGECSNSGPTLEIRIPAENVTATNRQVRGGQLWGTDVYTYDSDLVAVLMHTGYCRPTASPPPTAIQELRATIRVLPRQDCYISTLRNNVRSRAWGAATIGCSYRVERCCIVKRGGGTIDLEPCLTHTSTIEPTLAPVAVERTMTTRAAASNALRQQRFVREVTIQYNLCNEPWIKYSISIVADKGLKKALYTSARLKKGEVLYLETHSCRYELGFAGEKMVKTTPSSQLHNPDAEKSQNHHHSANGDKADSDSIMIDVFRWSRCKKPLPQKVMRTIGIPLPPEHIEVLEENLDWEDVQWSQTGVWIAGKEYTLARVHFLSMN